MPIHEVGDVTSTYSHLKKKVNYFVLSYTYYTGQNFEKFKMIGTPFIQTMWNFLYLDSNYIMNLKVKCVCSGETLIRMSGLLESLLVRDELGQNARKRA